MENLTHSLVGAALAELALPRDATPLQRRIFFIAGVVSANLPDADLLYTRITVPPLGYLLHHRGHTHTLGGLAAQLLAVALVCLLPAIRRGAAPRYGRLLALVAASLLSHLVLDSWNSYGVHPFWPFDVRWVYGDAIYILEPWLWVPLGIAAALNARRTNVGRALGVGIAMLIVALALLHMIPPLAFAALAAVALVLARLVRPLPPRRRAGVALAAVGLFVATTVTLRADAHRELLASRAPAVQGRLLDLVLNPAPGNPLCWTALAITTNEAAGEYTMTRGRVAPLLASGCGLPQGAGTPRVTWEAPVRQSLVALRELVRRDCAARAWMQFGRAPELRDGTIADMRFGGMSRGNFSSMRLGEGPGCPEHLTRWGLPRADLLEPGASAMR